jgi:hypothetical protein
MRIYVYVSKAGELLHGVGRKPDADGRFSTLCGLPMPACYRPHADDAAPLAGLTLACPECHRVMCLLVEKVQKEALRLEQPTPIQSVPGNNCPPVPQHVPTPERAGRKTGQARQSRKGANGPNDPGS